MVDGMSNRASASSTRCSSSSESVSERVRQWHHESQVIARASMCWTLRAALADVSERTATVVINPVSAM